MSTPGKGNLYVLMFLGKKSRLQITEIPDAIMPIVIGENTLGRIVTSLWSHLQQIFPHSQPVPIMQTMDITQDMELHKQVLDDLLEEITFKLAYFHGGLKEAVLN